MMFQMGELGKNGFLKIHSRVRRETDIGYVSACEWPKCKDTDGDGGAHA